MQVAKQLVEVVKKSEYLKSFVQFWDAGWLGVIKIWKKEFEKSEVKTFTSGK